MKTKIVITMIIVLFTMQISAQKSYIKNRWNIKLSSKIMQGDNEFMMSDDPFYHLGVNYGLHKYLELGVNSAFSSSSLGIRKRLQYYANCNFHILPLWVDSDEFRFDVYLISKAGGITYFHPPYTLENEGVSIEIEARRTHNFYYGGGGGIAFYPFSHVGLFSEYTFEKYNNTESMFFKYGLSVKF